MKGDITLKILETLKKNTLDSIDLLEAFLTSGYGSSFAAIEYNWNRISKKRSYKNSTEKAKDILTKKDWDKINKRFNAMLSKLKKDDLIEKSKNKSKIIIKITEKGKKKINDIKKKNSIFPNNNYKTAKNNNFILFMFDIPEKERNKRKWIRSVLTRMEFKLIQKSVWLGKTKIPKEFLNDLRKLGIIQFIEILEITKTGSLKQLT